MSDSNLFRMDDFLLRGAVVVGIAFALVASAIVSAAKTGAFVAGAGLVLALAALGIAPLAMGITGYRLRRREKRAVSLWKLIDREVEISDADLRRSSDWTVRHLDQAIRDINNTGVGYVVWDRSAGRIQNGRLRRSTVIVDECSACSGRSRSRSSSETAIAARCPFCHEPVDVASVVEEKARIIDELAADRSEPKPQAPRSSRVSARRPKNVGSVSSSSSCSSACSGRPRSGTASGIATAWPT